MLALTNLKKKSSINNLNLICADALEIPFSDNCFDRIFEVGVVEHFYDNSPFENNLVNRELIINSFWEIKRVMKMEVK